MQVIKTQEKISVAPDRDEGSRYHRYHIHTEVAPDIVPWPSRFRVKVNRAQLAALLIKEMVHFRGDREVVLSRPCVYGVFSGPIGGFAPREELCVGCLRCTTQYPDIVQIHHNPERLRLGDSYFTSEYINAVAYESATGRIPVKGAGYRGAFGGEGWDGMWTDMSEIVRPTRDGIHGREFISTVVDIGTRPSYLTFDADGWPDGPEPQTFSLPQPLVFDLPPTTVFSETLCQIFSTVAHQIEAMAILPLGVMLDYSLDGPHLVPLVSPVDLESLESLTFTPRLIEMDGWDEGLHQAIRARFPGSLVCLRLPFTSAKALLSYHNAGMHVFHLVADYHGRGPDGTFVHDLIRTAHGAFVEQGIRDQVTLLGSGGIIAAEHVPKAIIAGLDAVVLDTPLLVALQAQFMEDCRHRQRCRLELPESMTVDWGVQRLKNLAAAWRDQLLEVLGAMGLREVRRLRGEVGRVMYQRDLEREAFGEIEGFDV